MNYTGRGRSNYVRIKDAEKLTAALKPAKDMIRLSWAGGAVAVISEKESGMLPDLEDGCDVLAILLDHMTIDPDNILIWVETGEEGSRYLGGEAFARHPSSDEVVSLALSEIYAMAHKTFGHRPAEAQH